MLKFQQSQNELLLLARQSFAFDYNYVIEHQYPLECKQSVKNIMEEIRKENEGGSEEENNVERSVINIKVEDEDGDTPLKEEDNLDIADVELGTPSDNDTPLKQEDNLDNADVELDTPSDNDKLVKQILEREVRIVLERTDIGASARQRTLNEVPQNAKRIKLDETTNDRNPLTMSSTLLKSLPKSNCKQSYKSFSKNSSLDLHVKISNNKRNVELVANCINKISPKVNILAKNEVQVEDMIAQSSEALTSKVVCNNAENDTIQQYLLKSADAIAPSISLGGSNEGKPSSICNPRKGLENELSSHIYQYKGILKSNLNKHITGENPYICDLCDYRCSRKSSLKNHIKYKHRKERNFSCHVCHYKCISKSCLDKHLRKHTGEKPYRCDLCDYRCSLKSSLARHIKCKHIKEMNFSCHICHYKCISKSYLTVHLRRHTGEKPYICDLCDCRCSRKSSLERHIKCKHTKEMNFSCHVCHYKCISKGHLTVHLRKHTGEKPYKCDLCDYRCSHKGSLAVHIKCKHTKEKNFTCHVCHYKCISKTYLAVHLRKHTGEKPYKCDLCDYRCSCKSSLEIHIKYKHTKERNFLCHLCQYKCVTKSDLNKHIRKHTGEKPYVHM